MKLTRIPILILTLFLATSSLHAQRTEIAISFGEQFFDALLDAVFQYAAPPEFSLARNEPDDRRVSSIGNSFAPRASACDETIRLLRETSGTRTGVRFREGKIIAPIAFTGKYNPPLLGCMPFSGVADAVIDLEFDPQGQRLLARARVQDVSLNGTGGIGSGIIARMVQGSIDKKINPIEIIKTNKVTFDLPLQNSNSVRMRAVGFRHDVANGMLTIRVAYEFEKSN
jgi:hypothetical protein